jgi:hypothetical protein
MFVPIAVLVLGGLWLFALTVGFLALLRQVAVLTMHPVSGSDEAAPRVGMDIVGVTADFPGELADLSDDMPSYLLFLSAGCAACDHLLADIKRQVAEEGPLPDRVILVTPGPFRTSKRLGTLPHSWSQIHGTTATEIADRLGVVTSPLALQVEQSVITGTSVPNNVDDLMRLTGSHTAEAVDIASAVRMRTPHHPDSARYLELQPVKKDS